jgi:hypothetical protein
MRLFFVDYSNQDLALRSENGDYWSVSYFHASKDKSDGIHLHRHLGGPPAIPYTEKTLPMGELGIDGECRVRSIDLTATSIQIQKFLESAIKGLGMTECRPELCEGGGNVGLVTANSREYSGTMLGFEAGKGMYKRGARRFKSDHARHIAPVRFRVKPESVYTYRKVGAFERFHFHDGNIIGSLRWVLARLAKWERLLEMEFKVNRGYYSFYLYDNMISGRQL